MARLNEPPALGESLEALKRRFIRQNREIARANSTQSQKIRSLECEISRLLSENIALREEKIQLQKAFENAQRANATVLGPCLRQKLQTKLDEMNALISDLDKAQENSEIKVTPGQVRRKSIKRASNPRVWRSSFDLNELALAEGRLPPIFENKFHPRQTFTTEEFLATIPCISNSTDSPEPGPPPVAHFEQGDPVKRDQADATLLNNSLAHNEHLGSDEATAFLSSNLETRRRRKESSHGKELSAMFEDTPTEKQTVLSESDAATSQSLKAGAKRKHSATEEDSRKPLSKSTSHEDLPSQRRQGTENQVNPPMARSKSHRDLNVLKTNSREKPSSTTITTMSSRKALEEKPINTDPVVSPTKSHLSAKDKHRDRDRGKSSLDLPKKDQLNHRRERVHTKSSKPTIRQIRPISLPVDPPTFDPPSTTDVNIDYLQDLPPVTPAALTSDDVFSPSTAPSTAKPDIPRDTPPPSDNSGNRPSRRQRSAVSYAEPSLRDKMRRPTKDFVDAVPIGSTQRSSSVREEDRLSRSIGADSILIKKEPGEDGHQASWKVHEVATPGSPLSGKSAAAHSTVVEDRHHTDQASDTLTELRHRKPSILRSADEDNGERRKSTSQETIAALVASSSKKIARARDPFLSSSTLAATKPTPTNGTSSTSTKPSTSGSTPRFTRPPTAGKLSASASVPALVESLSVFDLHGSPEKESGKLSVMEALKESARARQIRGVGIVRRTASVSELGRTEGPGRTRDRSGSKDRSAGKEAGDSGRLEQSSRHANERDDGAESGRTSRSRRRETTAGSAGAAAGSESEGAKEDGRMAARRAERAERRRSMMV